ncbi:hypothetical protein M2146_000357 [Lachnospiraceae bacterium PF1-22]|uniref:DUF5688 family protein n=1 Tax=Ohessyouella blattaphilus TaxID=2949333 RepID=UPI003E252CA7
MSILKCQQKLNISKDEYSNIKKQLVPILYGTSTKIESGAGAGTARIHMGDLILSSIFIPTNGKIAQFVTKDNLLEWNISINEVVNQAMVNIQGTEILHDLESLVKQISSDGEAPNLFETMNIRNKTSKMYVLSNKSRFYGAAMIMNSKVMEKVRHIIGESFYILPSSIHETILVVDDSNSVDDLKEIVKAVNLSELKDEDILSYGVYQYNYEKDQVELL